MAVRKSAPKFVAKEKREKDLSKEAYQFGLSIGVVRDVLLARNVFSKIFWTFLGVLAFALFAFATYGLVRDYCYSSRITVVDYQPSSSVKFPDITICTYSRINATKVKNIDERLLSYMMGTFKGVYHFYNLYNLRHQAAALEQQYADFVAQEEDFRIRKFFLQNGFNCNEFLASCIAQGAQFNCCSGKEFLGETGKCFTLNDKVFPWATIPGIEGGKSVVVHNLADLYPQSLINSYPDMGIQLHIGDSMSSSPISVPPGMRASIALKSTNISSISNCVNERTLKYFPKYSYANCYKECLADMTLKTCGCIQLGAVPGLESSSDCIPEASAHCVQPLLQANNMGFLWDIYDVQKECYCPELCQQTTYDVAVSYSSINNPAYQRSWDMQANDTIIVDIYFETLTQKTITESYSYTYTTLLSHIGGHLSLWLGFRLIAFYHLVYFGLAALIGKLRKTQTKIEPQSNGDVAQGTLC